MSSTDPLSTSSAPCQNILSVLWSITFLQPIFAHFIDSLRSLSSLLSPSSVTQLTWFPVSSSVFRSQAYQIKDYPMDFYFGRVNRLGTKCQIRFSGFGFRDFRVCTYERIYRCTVALLVPQGFCVYSILGNKARLVVYHICYCLWPNRRTDGQKDILAHD